MDFGLYLGVDTTEAIGKSTIDSYHYLLDENSQLVISAQSYSFRHWKVDHSGEMLTQILLWSIMVLQLEVILPTDAIHEGQTILNLFL